MKKIQGLEDYNLEQVNNIILFHFHYLRENLILEDLDFSIKEIIPFGSRVFGTSNENSDLDVKIKYTGSAHEDDLFNALNDRHARLKIENVIVDFFPERIQK